MADLAESTAKLQLDEVTGEMVSKGELKKRMKKREKAATTAKAREAAAAAAPAEDKKAAPPKPKEKAEAAAVDPEVMFKTGFLNEVFNVVKPVRPVLTRFPPEPNGFLHAGHVKSIIINFGSSRFYGGECNLRYDDTNPEAEEQIYFDAILDMVKWLGFTPARITYSSDFFQQLYDDAEKLIGLGKAYVCHCGDAELKLQRGGEKGTAGPRYRCQHADQSVEENLKKFRDMRDGHYKPQAAFLRMKQEYVASYITDGNPQMWDLAAYRVLDKPHFRTGDKWKIYPTYDFAHCLCDAYEGVTHSLCTTEFVLSRTSYEWLNDTVGRTGPTQREFGKLTIAGTILSKRKILKLVQDKIVRGWNDPRLYTLIGIKRRGVPPGALLEFIQSLGGVTTANSVMEIKRFEQSVRKYLERTVPRLMLVLDPVPVVIEDADDVDGNSIDIPFHQGDPKLGSREIKFTKTVYIDRSDFREEADPSFFRLVPGKSVGLLSAPFPIKAVSFTKDDATGKVKEIRAVFDREGKKSKAYIQWVPSDARRVEVRIYNPLFKSNNPNDAPGGFLNDINPDSEIIYPDALLEAGIDEVKRRAPWPEAVGEGKGVSGPEGVRFQGTRVGYFAMDSDSTDEKMVLNRIVALKEDAGKS